MDVYGFFDLIAVCAGVLIAFHVRTRESTLLALFFSLSSIVALVLFQTDYFIYWPHVFIALSVVFGLATSRHPVTLGYAFYLVLIGLNSIYEVTAYSLYVYLIYAYQLWVVHYESSGSRVGCIWISHPDKAHYKNHKEKAPL